MLIPSASISCLVVLTSLSRRVNANSQLTKYDSHNYTKLIKKGEC
ncbi:hypothetical protein MCC10015_1616 [Bifidobacterium longum subsp. longum]|uniref:Uncharacterized protein n=1 Tax=Bifidobacterium longum subsp. longum TaxID=1679 RepID=A0A4R0T8E9_BIFLL|nr:hypothetical protein MCC10015_1616 [Bifidobacterium longum subsp. longum]